MNVVYIVWLESWQADGFYVFEDPDEADEFASIYTDAGVLEESVFMKDSEQTKALLAEAKYS